MFSAVRKSKSKSEHFMKLVVRVISLGLVFVVMGVVLSGVNPTLAAAHAPGVSLTGWGTATIDRIMSPGEWDGAAQSTFEAKLPVYGIGGTTPVTIFVMNDTTNLYLAAKIENKQMSVDTTVMFAFDNDHDSNSEPEVGDDYVAVSRRLSGYPYVRFDDGYLFPRDAKSFNTGIAYLSDTAPMGRPPWGTSEGAGDVGLVGNANPRYGTSFTFVEMSHPLNTTDDLHDFSLHFGQTVGFSVRVQLSAVDPVTCDPPERLAQCYGLTYFPQTAGGGMLYGDIVIQSPYEFTGFIPPVDNLPTVNVASAGQTVPLKWSIKDRSNGQYVSDLGVVSSYGFQGSSCSPGAADTIDTRASARASDLRYSPQEKQIVLNWRTDHSWAGKCGTMTLTLVDGTQHKANFQFK